MNINWRKVKLESPKAFKLFCDELDLFLRNNILEYRLMDTSPCYCDFEKFFDNLGIIIEIVIDSNTYQNVYDEFCWYFIIQIKNVEENKFEGFVEIEDLKYSTRSEAKEQAIYYAFRILEEI